MEAGQVLSSKEVHDIAVALGVDPGSADLSRLRYGRVCILGEMNPMQLRESTMAPETRRLVQLTLPEDDQSDRMMDMLLAKKRAPDRKDWLERKGDLATLQVCSDLWVYWLK